MNIELPTNGSQFVPLFMAAYTHLLILLSIFESILQGKQFDLSQKVVSRLLQDPPSPLEDKLFSLFFVCLGFGPESNTGASGMYQSF